jgi:hypothetical protein
MIGVEDALKGMTRRQMEEMRATLERELRSCSLCGTEGASTFRVIATSGSLRGQRASLRMCLPCFEKNRLPEGRTDEATV